MRLVAQVKAGFYPAHPDAVASLATRITCEDPAATALLDPCCGRAAAINQLREQLGVPAERTYLIELDAARAEEAKAAVPGAHLLARTDFIGSEASARSFGFVWLNPPFDDEMGGGARVEQKFLGKVGPMLVPGGVLCFVLPQHVLERKHDLQTLLMSWYQRITVVPFPADARPFNEVCVFAAKRAMGVEGAKLSWAEQASYDEAGEFQIPPAGGPKRWAKTAFTEDELAYHLGLSRLNKLLRPPPPLPAPRPGLQLGQGQQALVLAGGFLNRVLQLDGQPPILIKATPYKKDVNKGTVVEDLGDGETRSTTVISQKIGLRVRVLDVAGKIHDLADVEEKGEGDAPSTDAPN